MAQSGQVREAPSRAGLERRGRAAARKDSLRVAIGYAIVAELWILLSDRALGLLELAPSAERFLGSVKGTAFVAVTALLLYLLTIRGLAQLYASEARYRRLFNCSTESIMLLRLVHDEQGVLTDILVADANPVRLETWHVTSEQLVGKRLADVRMASQEIEAYSRLVRDAVSGGEARAALHFEDGDLYVLAYAYPIDRDLWAVATTDVTENRRAQEAVRRQEEQIRQAYVDVLDAVTGGKLVLVTEEELEASLGEPLTELGEIDTPSKLGEARRRIESASCARFPSLREGMLANAVGEALNNTLKHATAGTYQVFARDSYVQVMITDSGPGIDFRSLPKATLLSGFSTTATLGLGFTIMLQLCDRVLLFTRPGRTVVVLELSASGREDFASPFTRDSAAAAPM